MLLTTRTIETAVRRTEGGAPSCFTIPLGNVPHGAACVLRRMARVSTQAASQALSLYPVDGNNGVYTRSVAAHDAILAKL